MSYLNKNKIQNTFCTNQAMVQSPSSILPADNIQNKQDAFVASASKNNPQSKNKGK